MIQNKHIILGIESSCDETAAALVTDDRQILAQQIASSAPIHADFGGVVPEIAARQHLEMITPVITNTLAQAGVKLSEIDGVAATGGPGLIGGLLVGTMVAKAISSACKVPYYAINHLEGHALSARLSHDFGDNLEFPYLLLLVSGGHTQILAVFGVGDYQRLGTTLDDAAGEAFDKGAAILGLGYPGGPAIESHARTGNAAAVELPRPRKTADDCHFSFSGLKTALARKWQLAQEAGTANRQDFAASLQEAIADCLISRLERAFSLFSKSSDKHQLVIAGGVAANQHIGTRLRQLVKETGYKLIIPPADLCTDNAAMIAWAGQEHHSVGYKSDLGFAPKPRWPLDKDAPSPPGGKAVRQ